jgi:hypothetical protein
VKPRRSDEWICDQYADNEAVRYGKPVSWIVSKADNPSGHGAKSRVWERDLIIIG